MILTVTLNPCIDRTIFVDSLHANDTNRVIRTETDAGGKGLNLSRVVAELGGDTVALGFLGGGPGAFIRQVLQDQRVEHDFVSIQKETRINFSVEESGNIPPTTFNERGPTISGTEWDEFLSKYDDWIQRAHWVCLGGSIPPGVKEDVYLDLIGRAKEAGCLVALDADGRLLEMGLKLSPDLVKPNVAEAERLLKRSLLNVDEQWIAVLEILQRGATRVILSRGKDGALMATSTGRWTGVSPVVEPKSTIGSGDSMIAGFLWALENQKGEAEALRWGLASGAATAETSGAEIARLPEIKRLFPSALVEPY